MLVRQGTPCGLRANRGHQLLMLENERALRNNIYGVICDTRVRTLQLPLIFSVKTKTKPTAGHIRLDATYVIQ